MLAFLSVSFWLFQFANGAAISTSVLCPDGKNTVTNTACCALFPVLDDLQQNIFENNSPCTEEAKEILQVAFHDAIGFSTSGGLGGGADGSIITFDSIETTYHANSVIDDTIAFMKPFFTRHNLSAGDILHFAAAVGVSSCPGAPRLPYMMGRPPAKAPAPDHTVPEPTDSVSTILARFASAGFSPSEVVALLSAHSIATSYSNIDGQEGIPLDTTPNVYDAQIFLEVLLVGTHPPLNGSVGQVNSPIPGELRLQSDFQIARDPRTACAWQVLITNPTKMSADFKAAMTKLSLLGQDITKMTDCSDVIPVPQQIVPRPHFPSGHGLVDIQSACAATNFPSVLPTDPGPSLTLSPAQCPFCWHSLTSPASIALPSTVIASGSSAVIQSGPTTTATNSASHTNAQSSSTPLQPSLSSTLISTGRRF